MTPELSQILKTFEAKKYKLFDNDKAPYNINIVGIRTLDMTPNKFNDWEYVFWKHAGSWEVLKFQVTTDPGLYYLKSPMNELGTAIVKPGQYLNLWKRGLHQGKYTALTQAGPVTVYRDGNRDQQYDITGKEQTGIFGINNHRSAENGRSIMVDRWSAGCIVFADYYQFEIFMRLVSEAEKLGVLLFTFTLITEQEIKDANH